MRRLRNSLRWRLVVVGVSVVAFVVISLDVFVYFRLRDQLEETLDVVLASRLELAEQLADQFGVEGLGDRLADAGVPGVVERADGVVEPAVPVTRRFVELPPDLVNELGGNFKVASTIRDDGTLIEVAASRAGIARTLRTIVVIEGFGSLTVIALSGFLLHRAAGLVLRPIDRVVAVARRTAAGQTGERLAPREPASELGRMTTAFNEMLDAQEHALAQAQTAEQRSRTFLAEAAHQLRTPIAGMRAASEALLLTDDADERDELVANIGLAGARAGRLMSRLLRLAELDEGVTRVEPRSVDLGQAARDEVAALQLIHPDHTITVEVTGDPVVTIDENGIHEAIANLLDNSQRHGRAPTTVRITGTGTRVTLAVSDAGAGIPAPDRERVFERFTSLHGDGSGLGLAVVRSIVVGQGGTASANDDGVVITVPRG